MLNHALDIHIHTKGILEEFDAFCKEHGLVGLVRVDHIGLRCSSDDIYQRQKKLFDFESRFIYKSIISKRQISIIGLLQGLPTIVGEINYLELSNQKPDGSQRDVFDHCEVVPTTISYDELVEKLSTKNIIM